MIAPNGNGLAPEGAQPDDPTPCRASATAMESRHVLPCGATPWAVTDLATLRALDGSATDGDITGWLTLAGWVCRPEVTQ